MWLITFRAILGIGAEVTGKCRRDLYKLQFWWISLYKFWLQTMEKEAILSLKRFSEKVFRKLFHYFENKILVKSFEVEQATAYLFCISLHKIPLIKKGVHL